MTATEQMDIRGNYGQEAHETSMEPLFLTPDEVLEIHAQQIELYGGSEGVRDPAGFESAVATPMATFGGELLHPAIPSMAAAYLFPLSESPIRRRQ
jgi:hypothetical protein